MIKRITSNIVLLIFITTLNAQQQRPDSLFVKTIEKPTFKKSLGPKVYIDEAHYNFHTLNGGYKSFALVLEADGCTVKENREKFDIGVLDKMDILVISNPVYDTMTFPRVKPSKSAFTKKEIESVKDWVSKGGSLFLIADHMPFAGSANKLARAFGFEFYDSFVLDSEMKGNFNFSREDNTLNSTSVTNGVGEGQSLVSKVRAFTGSAFKIPKNAESVLKLKKEQRVFLPDTVWKFHKNTEKFSANGLSQGAVLEFGKGRIAVFGEAAMFTAQLYGENLDEKIWNEYRGRKGKLKTFIKYYSLVVPKITNQKLFFPSRKSIKL